jgi:hypothetical protein
VSASLNSFRAIAARAWPDWRVEVYRQELDLVVVLKASERAIEAASALERPLMDQGVGLRRLVALSTKPRKHGELKRYGHKRGIKTRKGQAY